ASGNNFPDYSWRDSAERRLQGPSSQARRVALRSNNPHQQEPLTFACPALPERLLSSALTDGYRCFHSSPHDEQSTPFHHLPHFERCSPQSLLLALNAFA